MAHTAGHKANKNIGEAEAKMINIFQRIKVHSQLQCSNMVTIQINSRNYSILEEYMGETKDS